MPPFHATDKLHPGLSHILISGHQALSDNPVNADDIRLMAQAIHEWWETVGA